MEINIKHKHNHQNYNYDLVEKYLFSQNKDVTIVTF